MRQDVRRDQPEHSQPLETKRVTSSAARQEDFASPAHMTRLSEHIVRVSVVLRFSAVTIRSLVHEWLDTEGLDVRPGREWVRQLLHGVSLSCKKPAKCVKELHNPGQQHANTHWLFIKLCWLMSTCGVSADRVVNIDETSCRLLLVHQMGWGDRGVKQAQLQGNSREATTFMVAFSMDRAGHVGADRARGQDTRRLSGAALDRTYSPRHVREWLT